MNVLETSVNVGVENIMGHLVISEKLLKKCFMLLDRTAVNPNSPDCARVWLMGCAVR